ncbi:MAG: sugar ABC transporter permease [Actinobacteria bacterium]|nr:sugar ABC transporter permease [Actinomycetota bacterium]
MGIQASVEVGSATAAQPRTPGRRPSHRKRRDWAGLVFQAPSLIVLAAVVLFPLAYSIDLSFRSFSLVVPGRTGQYIGLGNYQKMFRDGDFGQALATTLIFIVVAVTLETVLGVAAGMLLDRLRRLKRLVTSILLLPMIIAPLVVGLVFNFALNAQFGYLTWALHALGLPGGDGALNYGPTALLALILVDVWEWAPFMTLMVAAGLSALPKEPFEAASVDGAGPWQTFQMLTLPMLRPVLAVAILFRATEAIREFDKVYVLTGGGPGSWTTVNDLYQYRVSFAEWDLSYGAALGLVTFLAVLVLAISAFRMLAPKEV